MTSMILIALQGLRPFSRSAITLSILGFALAGCARYAPVPLELLSSASENLDALIGAEEPPGVDSESQRTPLGMDEIAALAVRRSPQLTALRKQLGVAEAQVFSAGLLPDPQIAANFDHPFSGLPGLVNAIGGAFRYELAAILTRPARREAERQRAEQLRLDVLWQEWQVAQQARLAVVRIISERRRLVLLKAMLELYSVRFDRSNLALADGDLTLDIVGTDLTALLDTTTQVNVAEQGLARTGQELNLLLGLAPATMVPLADALGCEKFSPRSITDALQGLPQRRPDLLGLQAGYLSQESRVRAAVLAQFPSITLGGSGARDTGAVHTGGLTVGMVLPVFSGNRGSIAIERATRGQLQAEFTARIAQAQTDVATIASLQNVVDEQRARLEKHLPSLQEFVRLGRGAYDNADIDALTFLNMELTLTNKRIEMITLEQATCENQIALDTLLANHAQSTGVDTP